MGSGHLVSDGFENRRGYKPETTGITKHLTAIGLRIWDLRFIA